MTSQKFFTHFLFMITTVALTSTPFAHGAWDLPTGLDPLPDLSDRMADPDTAQELQLAIKQKQILHGSKSQLKEVQHLLKEALTSPLPKWISNPEWQHDETKNTDDAYLAETEQTTNRNQINNLLFMRDRLMVQIAKYNQLKTCNHTIIENSSGRQDDPTTNKVAQAMHSLSDEEKKYRDELKKKNPNTKDIETFASEIGKFRQIISSGLRKGIYPNSERQINMLEHAIDTHNELVALYLIKNYFVDKDYHYLLARILRTGNYEIAKMLLRACKLNYEKNSFGIYKSWNMRILHDALMYKNEETFQAIISAVNLDPNELLESCFLGNNFTFLKEILTAGADANRKNSCGKTPLQTIIRYRDLVILRIFLQYAAKFNVNVQYSDGQTPLDKVSAQAIAVQDELNPGRDTTDLESQIQSAVLLIQAGANTIQPNLQVCGYTQSCRKDLFNQIFEAYETKATKITELQRRASDLLIEEAKKKRLSNEMNNRK